MSNVKELKRKPNVAGITSFEHYKKRCENGMVSDFVIVTAGHDKGGTPIFSFNTNMEDGWRLIAALEYAKAGVMETITRNADETDIRSDY